MWLIDLPTALAQWQAALTALAQATAVLAQVAGTSPPATPPPPPPVVVVTPPAAVESAQGATVPPLPALIDSKLAAWTLVNGKVAQGGVVDAVTGGVTQLVYCNHQVSQEANNKWWFWNGTTWISEAGDPRLVP